MSFLIIQLCIVISCIIYVAKKNYNINQYTMGSSYLNKKNISSGISILLIIFNSSGLAISMG